MYNLFIYGEVNYKVNSIYNNYYNVIKISKPFKRWPTRCNYFGLFIYS